MPKGGARTRSGPQADLSSLRSAQRGLSLTALPSEGYQETAPALEDFLTEPTARQVALWSQLWRTPQACAWAKQAWRWPIVADLVMYRARADADDAPASLATAVRQLRDDLGLSEAGLKANGWAIAEDETAERRPGRQPAKKPSARDRLKVVAGDGA